MAEELTPAQEAENQATLDKVEQHQKDLQEQITGQSDEIPEGFNADGTEIEKELIGGKFESNEELLKAYQELEKKLGSGEETATPPDEGNEPPKEIETPPKEEAPTEPTGLAKFNQEYAENGELSQDSYDELGKLGFSKTDVDNYIAGQQALAD